jgi:biopolymer transport protein ExbD
VSDPSPHPESAPAGVPEALLFQRAEEAGQGELDMTPMVDVTFLLLIFFMVTAAFGMQKSLPVPPPDQEQHAVQTRTLDEIEEDDDYVVVRIGEDDSVFVDGVEAPSRQELLVKLREARQGLPGSDSAGPSNLLVLAHGDCRHETVVMAIDAGNAAGMEHVRLATGGEEEF